LGAGRVPDGGLRLVLGCRRAAGGRGQALVTADRREITACRDPGPWNLVTGARWPVWRRQGSLWGSGEAPLVPL